MTKHIHAALLCLLLAPAAFAQTPSYTVTDLGSFGTTSDGSSYARASSLSADGSVVGTSSLADPLNGITGTAPFLWQHGTLSNLGTLRTPNAPGYGSAAAVGINGREQAAGYSDWIDYSLYRGTRACLYQDGYVLNLGTLGENTDGYGDSRAVRVNDAGQVIGSAQVYLPDGSSPGRAPVLWNGLLPTDLGTLGVGVNGQRNGTALRINNAAQVIGNTSVYDDAHNARGTAAFFWQNGRISDMTGSTFGEDTYGYRQATASDLNAKGQAIGNASQYDASFQFVGGVAFLWQNGRITPITLAKHGSTHAIAMNDAAQVVGYVFRIDSPTNTSRTDGFLWQSGRAVDLGRLGADAQGNGYTRPTAINSAGQVVGLSYVYDSNNPYGIAHPFVWQNGRMTDLFPLLPADTEPYSLAQSFPRINAQGEITVNVSRLNLGTHTLLLRPAGAHTATAVDISAGTDSTTCLLWNNINGSAFFWRMAADSGTPSPSPTFGPYPGWGARAVAAAPDGGTRLLWTNTDGRASVWTISANGAISYGPAFGPYAGWSARDITAGTDGSTRLLWVNQNGWAAHWTLPAQGAIVYSPIAYGPYGAHAKTAATARDRVTRLLWTTADGGAFVQMFTLDGRVVNTAAVGPFSGWLVQDALASLNLQNRLLWANADGRAWLSTTNSTDNPARPNPGLGSNVFLYGEAGWTPRRVAALPDNTTLLLWTNADGRVALWTISTDGQRVTQKKVFGPL